jgi:hypothetical protein
MSFAKGYRAGYLVPALALRFIHPEPVSYSRKLFVRRPSTLARCPTAVVRGAAVHEKRQNRAVRLFYMLAYRESTHGEGHELVYVAELVIVGDTVLVNMLAAFTGVYSSNWVIPTSGALLDVLL